MAAAPELVALSPPRAVGRVAGINVLASVSGPPQEAVRVRCTSKRAVTDMLELCGGFVQNLGDALPEEIRELALRGAQWVRAQSPSLLARLPHTQKQYHPVVHPLDLKYDPDPACHMENAEEKQ
ncbi:kinetochore-associated protein NSL1 homolog isoform X2 [Manis pentadactyla]|uniref:kinetochore-associated protein NSL1 homolog isoform X2 n=1 Tax=Manis pentadactyla TaxID=143292 RepID=UPI00255C4C6C|nr:kinetochore-associated protein NSL1 homolog isoform X2 [Manis pentadactyla]XP_057363970.1 kinetochore-associated protein NSL1 homolog isoform X2 [Manis pentadactyla]KAI5168874.1 Kinetochore-Associated Protein Nsl1 [Manis pentadactyla]